jgi:hypothetical protein
MAETLSSIIQSVAYELGQTEEFVATTNTAGSVTTTPCTTWSALDDPPEEEKFKNHYLVVKNTITGTAPKGEWGLISAYAVDTQIFTHAALTVKTAVGDTVLFYNQSVFPFLEIITAVNRALRKVGTLQYVEATLTTATAQTEYSLPAGIIKIRDIQRQGITTDANDNRYYSLTGWRVYPTTTTLSTRPILIIPQNATGYTLKIIYDGYHPEVSLPGDRIHESITPSLLYALTKYYVLENFINKRGGNVEKHWINERMVAAQEAGVEPGPEKTLTKHVGMHWDDSAKAEDEFTWPAP